MADDETPETQTPRLVLVRPPDTRDPDDILPPEPEPGVVVPGPGAFEAYQNREREAPATPERLEQALARANTPEELSQVAAVAEAARRLYKRARRHLSEQNKYALVRLQALRKLGTLLASMPKHRGAANARLHDVTAPTATTLADLGISKRDSARWQGLARIPEGLFRQHCKKITVRGGQLSEASFHTLIRRREEAEEPARRWTLDEAVRRLRRLLDAVLQRCPGSESHEALAGTLRAWAKEIEEGPPHETK